jgi:hypothetical protein
MLQGHSCLVQVMISGAVLLCFQIFVLLSWVHYSPFSLLRGSVLLELRSIGIEPVYVAFKRFFHYQGF